MKKICFVKMDMMDASGGARVAANLANELAKKYEVHVVSICSDEDRTFYKLDDTVKYDVLIKGKERIRKVLFGGVQRLRRYLKENNIDIAFSVGVSINVFVIPATIGLKTQAVSCEHLNCLNEYENTKSQRFCRYIGAKFAKKVVVLTEQDKDAYIDKYHIKKNKVRYIHNWIDDSLLQEENDYNITSKKIISVVRIEPVKGIEAIIEASKELANKFPDWQWDIYGGGEQEYIDQLNNQIHENKLDGFVTLKGKVTNIYDLYKEYALFVLTSYCEGLPMVLLEAKSKKLPCICFDCKTGPREIVRDNVDGYLVEVDDTQSLVFRILECMKDNELRQKLSNETYGNISKFKKELIIQQWIEFIDNF